MAAIQTTEEMFAAIGAMCAKAPKAPAPISAEQAAATRAALDAKFRAGDAVSTRDCKGQFNGAARIAHFGGDAPIPAHNAPKAKSETQARTIRPVTAEAVAVVTGA
jgi:hypothetical protein